MKGWIIFVSAFALYFVSIFGGFVQDDLKVIAGDPEMGRVESLIKVWTRPYYYMDQEKSLYRPVTSFSLYLNAVVTGKGAWGFRLGNVLLYAWVCWLVYEVIRKFLDGSWIATARSTEIRNDKGWSGWNGLVFWWAMVFVVMPVHTEVVNNIVGRAEMLSLGFMLLAILENFKKRWDVSALLLLLAMLSKETAVIGVPILMYLSVTNREVDKDQKTASMVLVIMALLGFGMMRLMVLGGGGMQTRATIVENPLKFVTAEKRIMNGIALIPFGVGKVLFPVNLSYDYSYNQIKLVESWTDWRVAVGIVMFLVSLLMIPGLPRFGLPKLAMTGLVGMMLFWGPILITGNILFPIGTIFGERLWFLPSLGLTLIVMSLFVDMLKRKNNQVNLAMTVLIIIFVMCSGRTFIRSLNWLSQERLFLHDGEVATGSVMAQSNKAAIYLMNNDLQNAKKYMEKADEIYPKYPELLNNWGLYYSWTGNKVEAQKKFEECLISRPGYELCERNMENFY